MLEKALVEEFSAIAELNGKIEPLNIPEGTRPPYLVYVSSEGMPDKSLNGFHETKEVSITLNLLDKQYAGLKPLTKTILSKLQSFIGRTIGTSGPYIQDVTYDDPVELFEPEVNLYRCNIDVKIRF